MTDFTSLGDPWPQYQLVFTALCTTGYWWYKLRCWRSLHFMLHHSTMSSSHFSVRSFCLLFLLQFETEWPSPVSRHTFDTCDRRSLASTIKL